MILVQELRICGLKTGPSNHHFLVLTFRKHMNHYVLPIFLTASYYGSSSETRALLLFDSIVSLFFTPNLFYSIKNKKMVRHICNWGLPYLLSGCAKEDSTNVTQKGDVWNNLLNTCIWHPFWSLNQSLTHVLLILFFYFFILKFLVP